MVTEDRLKRIRASICLLPDPGYEVARELLEEIARLREGLRLITCESVNAEYMAQNILDGLPAYHDTMLVPNETPNHAPDLPAVGACHWCDAIVPDEHRFCDTDCRDDHQKDLVARRVRGFAP